jgi:hypothetical protein
LTGDLNQNLANLHETADLEKEIENNEETMDQRLIKTLETWQFGLSFNTIRDIFICFGQN